MKYLSLTIDFPALDPQSPLTIIKIDPTGKCSCFMVESKYLRIHSLNAYLLLKRFETRSAHVRFNATSLYIIPCCHKNVLLCTPSGGNTVRGNRLLPWKGEKPTLSSNFLWKYPIVRSPDRKVLTLLHLMCLDFESKEFT